VGENSVRNIKTVEMISLPVRNNKILVWHRPSPSKKRHIEKGRAFSLPKLAFLFGHQKQVSIWQRGSPFKNSHIDDDLILVFKKKTDTYSQGYYCQTENWEIHCAWRTDLLVRQLPVGIFQCKTVSQ
jgi:hypothetical protein